MRSRVILILLAFASLAVAGAWVFQQAALAQEEKDKAEAKAELGVYAQDVTETMAKKLDLPGTDGAYITGVRGRSAAYDAGFRNGDVIVEVEGRAVKNADDLAAMIKGHKVGDKISVTLIRKGQRQTLVATLKEKKAYWDHLAILKAGPHADKRVIIRPKIAALFGRPRIGINYQELNKQLGEYFGVEGSKGVLITEVLEDSPAEKAALMAGDIIVSVDGKQISNGSDLREAIWEFEGEEGEAITLEVIRKGQPMTFSVVPEKGADPTWHIRTPLISEHLGPALEGLDFEMDALKMKLDRLEDLDIYIPDVDINVPDFLYIPEHLVPPLSIHIDPFDELFGFHLSIDSDGSVVFNDKEFNSVEEFEKYIDSDEFETFQKEQREKLKQKIEDKLEKVKTLNPSFVVV